MNDVDVISNVISIIAIIINIFVIAYLMRRGKRAAKANSKNEG